jgi:hypothetical protein
MLAVAIVVAAQSGSAEAFVPAAAMMVPGWFAIQLTFWREAARARNLPAAILDGEAVWDDDAATAAGGAGHGSGAEDRRRIIGGWRVCTATGA